MYALLESISPVRAMDWNFAKIYFYKMLKKSCFHMNSMCDCGTRTREEIHEILFVCREQ